jgi:hypothetical protein
MEVKGTLISKCYLITKKELFRTRIKQILILRMSMIGPIMILQIINIGLMTTRHKMETFQCPI